MNDFASSNCHDRIADFKITQVQRDSHFDMGESHYHPYYEFLLSVVRPVPLFYQPQHLPALSGGSDYDSSLRAAPRSL